MTGPLRDRLAEALADLDRTYPGQPMPTFTRRHHERIADTLLPVVCAYAADQLRQAADGIDGSRRWDTQIARDLREQADQLDGGAA